MTPEGAVAVALALLAVTLDDHAHRGQVVDLVELLPALGHLLVDRVEVLGPSEDLCLDADLVELALEHLARLADERLPVSATLVHHRLDLPVAARMERLEGEILELPLDRVDAEAVCERCVHLERLARLLELFLLAEVLDRPHVVKAVGELDQDDPDVLGHRDHHLAVVLGLRLLPALELDPRQLGDALDELGDLLAELGTNLVDRGRCVLDDVVQQRRGERRVVEAQLGEDLGDAERMGDEILAASSLLAGMGFRSERERALDQVPVDVRVVGRRLPKEPLEDPVVPLGGGLLNDRSHGVSLASACPAEP